MATEDGQPQRFCVHCGKQNAITNRFCGNCGGALPVEPTGVAPAAPPPAQSSEVPPIAVVEAVAQPDIPPPASTAPTPDPVVTTPVQVVPSRPADGMSVVARERERDRLLTLANVQRMRDQSADARKTLEQALAFSEGMTDKQIAPIHELIGDLFDAEARWDSARIAYAKAHELDPQRVSAERKYAALTLRVAETKPGNSLAEAMIHGDSIKDLMATGAMASTRGRRNAGVAMILSMAIPGFGQFYNGEFVKGAIILGTYAATLLYFAVSPDHEIFMKKFAAMLALTRGHGANATVSPLSVFVGILLIAVWLYSIVDAPFTASKSASSGGIGGPVIDKTGWEV